MRLTVFCVAVAVVPMGLLVVRRQSALAARLLRRLLREFAGLLLGLVCELVDIGTDVLTCLIVLSKPRLARFHVAYQALLPVALVAGQSVAARRLAARSGSGLGLGLGFC